MPMKSILLEIRGHDRRITTQLLTKSRERKKQLLRWLGVCASDCILYALKLVPPERERYERMILLFSALFFLRNIRCGEKRYRIFYFIYDISTTSTRYTLFSLLFLLLNTSFADVLNGVLCTGYSRSHPPASLPLCSFSRTTCEI